MLCSRQYKNRQSTLFLVRNWRQECEPPFQTFESIGFGFTIGPYLYFVSMKRNYYFYLDKYLLLTVEREFAIKAGGSIHDLFECRRPTSSEWPPINPLAEINPFMPYRLKEATVLKQIHSRINRSATITMWILAKYFLILLIYNQFDENGEE
ncbi:hypothetical protein BLA29_011200 [Euroglyphus maynei]|uniref:Uncharacterized protein n=1 Tax=Euroglyphus maynei TaxID=6958 RepID=A0A1Y3BGL6_EURMA|nr:hypothetical protein BLA29_011200 [Euroglyphus maynei]